MQFPKNFPNIRHAPQGYSWVYRGYKWESFTKSHIAYITDEEDWWSYSSEPQLAGGHKLHYAELVKDGPVILTTDEKITLAKSMVGKTYTWNGGTPFLITGWNISKDDKDTKISVCVWNDIKDNGISVYVIGKNMTSSPVTDNRLKEVVTPKFLELKLNDTYTAKVYEDKVEVGCQTFDIHVLADLLLLHKQLKK